MKTLVELNEEINSIDEAALGATFGWAIVGGPLGLLIGSKLQNAMVGSAGNTKRLKKKFDKEKDEDKKANLKKKYEYYKAISDHDSETDIIGARAKVNHKEFKIDPTAETKAKWKKSKSDLKVRVKEREKLVAKWNFITR